MSLLSEDVVFEDFLPPRVRIILVIISGFCPGNSFALEWILAITGQYSKESIIAMTAVHPPTVANYSEDDVEDHDDDNGDDDDDADDDVCDHHGHDGNNYDDDDDDDDDDGDDDDGDDDDADDDDDDGGGGGGGGDDDDDDVCNGGDDVVTLYTFGAISSYTRVVACESTQQVSQNFSTFLTPMSNPNESATRSLKRHSLSCVLMPTVWWSQRTCSRQLQENRVGVH